MKLQNLIEKIIQSEENTIITPQEIITTLELKNWQPTNIVPELEEPKFILKTATEDSIDTKDIDRMSIHDAENAANRAVLAETTDSRNNKADFRYRFLCNPNEKKAPDWAIKQGVDSKIYSFFPKTRLFMLWAKMHDTYQKAYTEAMKNVDRDMIKNKILESRNNTFKSDFEREKQQYENKLKSTTQLREKVTKYELEGYINDNSLKNQTLIPGIIADKKESDSYPKENNWIKFRPIIRTTLEETIKNPEKYLDNYVFILARIGPYEENSRITGGMNAAVELNTRENVILESDSSSFLFFSENNSTVSKQSRSNIKYHNSAWITTKKDGVDFIIAGSENSERNAICSFPINGTLQAYLLCTDKEDKVLTSNIPETHLVLTLQNLKNKQVYLGGRINNGGIFKADTILSEYSKMSHNIGYLQNF
ncbi:MAG: hypothetical protein ACP5N1_00230 [Candidatus Woesearchaeota archaeon]